MDDVTRYFHVGLWGNVNNYDNGMSKLFGQVIGMPTYSQKFSVPAAEGDFHVHMPRITPPCVHVESESSSLLLPGGFCVSLCPDCAEAG